MHISMANALVPNAVGGRPSYHGNALSRNLGGQLPTWSVSRVYYGGEDAINGCSKQILTSSRHLR